MCGEMLLSRWPALYMLLFPLLMFIPMNESTEPLMLLFNLFYTPLLWFGAILILERRPLTASAGSTLSG